VKRPELIARQAARPSGGLGWLLGWIMALETAEANRIALGLLAPRRTDHVLEIGFGHGATISRLSPLVDEGMVAGIDVSPTMVRLATSRNRAEVARGRVRLCLGSADQLPYPDDAFDRILSVHTVYFWQQPQRAFAEIRRVLRPAGRFVLGWRDDPESRRQFPASVYRFQNEDAVAGMLSEVGLVLAGLSRYEQGSAVVHFAVCARSPC
jgi:SAM-dependent methyltransferase